MSEFSLSGRRLQIAGSASKNTDAELIKYAHQFTNLITEKVLMEGGGLVLGVGKEPLQTDSPDSPSLTYDWTILETAAKCFKKEAFNLINTSSPPPLTVITSEKAVSDIPVNRLPLWRELSLSGNMNIEYIQPGARSAAMVRDRQSQLADILVIIGGGTGVEHLANLFLNRRHPVIPLDLPVGASREDGTGGALKLSKEAKANTSKFFSLQSEYSGISGAIYNSLATRNGSEDVKAIAANTLILLSRLSRPVVFYTRLLNPAIASFSRVEMFFRNVVDPVVNDAGYTRCEIGTDASQEAFINVAIFNNLHYSSIAIIDLTENRLNCYMELGYALGRGIKVIMTAEEGTKLPFDLEAIPCHFWTANGENIRKQAKLKEFWKKYIDRLPLVI